MPSDARRSIARELSRYYATELAGNEVPDEPQFSVCRLLAAMTHPDGLTQSHEAKIARSAAALKGQSYDAHRPIVPFTAVRDLSAGIAPAGGFLVSTNVGGSVADILRPWSVTAAAGATILPGLVGNIALPRVTTAATGGWLSTETTAAPQNEPVIGQVMLAPKGAAAFARYSRQLAISAESAESFVRAQLLEAVGALLDQAVIAGSGASGQPTGITNTAGISTTSGTALAYSGLRAMRKAILSVGGREASIAWIGGVDAQEILGGRERTTNAGRYLWDDSGVLGRPAYATNYCTATTLIGADWSRAVIGIWGPGFTIEVDPYTAFQSGRIAARIILECDVAFITPGAFAVSTSIT